MKTVTAKHACGRVIAIGRMMVLAILGLAGAATAQFQDTKLTAGDPRSWDYFGHAVSVSGDTALVGAPGDEALNSIGSAYVFVRDASGSWTQQAQLSGGSEFGFGTSVALEGDTAIVGAPISLSLFGPPLSPGAAYVFVRDPAGTWTLQTALVQSDFIPLPGVEGSRFGDSVSLSGDMALVGAPLEDNVLITPGGITDSGATYVFARDGSGNWTEQAKLANASFEYENFGSSVSLSGDTALIGAVGGSSAHVFVRDGSGNWNRQETFSFYGVEFGSSVSLSGDTAIVGAPYTSSPGSAFVFVRDGAGSWNQQGTLVSGDTDLDGFGSSVSLSGDTAIIGSPAGNFSRGAAFVFERDETGNWTKLMRLIANDADVDDRFGAAVSLGGNRALIGAPLDDDVRDSSGSAYVLRVGGQEITADDAATDDWFGFSTALSGDTALVGAIGDDDRGTDSGSVYVLGRDGGSGWTQRAKLSGSDTATGDAFGVSVSLSDNVALVGANLDDDAGASSGAAYLFADNGTKWKQEAKLAAGNLGAGDRFGQAVSLDGTTALVSAIGDDDGGSSAGAVYVFGLNGAGSWTQQAKLTAGDAAAGDFFGNSVSVSGDTALIGAWTDDDAGNSSGSAYVFTRTPGGSWVQQSKLTADDARAGDLFGASVSLSGDTAVVGARDGGPMGSGAAYVFRRDPLGRWSQEARLVPGDAALNDRFGVSVALHGDMALVGASLDDAGAVDSGSVYVFTRDPATNAWTRLRKLTAADAAFGDSFGISVSLHGVTALVGAWKSEGVRSDSGSAYAFGVAGGSPATFSIYGIGCSGSAGTPTLNAAQGDRPWLGEVFDVDLMGLPTGIANTPLGFLGLSRTQWGALPLPVDLTHLGIWNCTAYVSVDASAALVNDAGTASWKIPIPLNANFIGMTLYLQGGCLDFGVNPANIILTNAGEAVLGIR